MNIFLIDQVVTESYGLGLISDLCLMPLPKEEITKLIEYKTSRSSGSGGQHVNKTETRVEAILNITLCDVLSDQQKKLIFTRLKNRIDKEGNLKVAASSSRYQKQNKKLATNRLLELVELALKKKKIRKKTGIPRSVKEKRLKNKKQRSELKSTRKFRPDM